MTRAFLKLLRIVRTGLWMEAHQSDAVPVGRQSSIKAEGLELEAGLVVHLPGHYGVAVLNAFLHLIPDVFSDPAGVIADINTSPDLQQPDGKPAA